MALAQSLSPGPGLVLTAQPQPGPPCPATVPYLCVPQDQQFPHLPNPSPGLPKRPWRQEAPCPTLPGHPSPPQHHIRDLPEHSPHLPPYLTHCFSNSSIHFPTLCLCPCCSLSLKGLLKPSCPRGFLFNLQMSPSGSLPIVIPP